MDGSDELAASVGERTGGVRAAVRFSRTDDAGAPEFEAQESAGTGCNQSGCRRTKRGGAGAFRQLSRDPVNAQVWIAILVGLAAMIDDLARRQIANWIPLAALAAGFGWQMGQSGLRGLLYAGIGTAAGFAVFLIFYLLGGMGGGDIKLMAGFGALLGFHQVLSAALWIGAVGGVLAVGVLAVRAVMRR